MSTIRQKKEALFYNLRQNSVTLFGNWKRGSNFFKDRRQIEHHRVAKKNNLPTQESYRDTDESPQGLDETPDSVGNVEIKLPVPLRAHRCLLSD